MRLAQGDQLSTGAAAPHPRRNCARPAGLDDALGGRGIIGDVTPDPSRQLLTIGEFAHQTRLTAKALRIYDEIGLLRPSDIDPQRAPPLRSRSNRRARSSAPSVGT